MSGVIDALFGGSTSTTPDQTPAEFKALRAPFANLLKTLMGSGTGAAPLTGIPEYKGPMVAEMRPGEEAATAQFDPSDPLNQSRRALLQKTQAGGFLPGSGGENPFLRAAIEAAQRPTLEGLTETLGRVLPGRFTQGGQFTQPGGSSAFDRAAAIATRGAGQAMGDIASTMSFGVHEGERNRQQESIGLGQAEVQTMVQGLQAQALPRLIEDMGIERGMELFQQRVQGLLQALGAITQTPLQTLGRTEKTSPNIVGTLLNPFSFAR